jgi:hypothetical protein
MLVQRISPWSYTLNTMDLPITLEQLQRYQSGGTLIQDAFPHLTADQREFIKTGLTPDDWVALCSLEERVSEDH